MKYLQKQILITLLIISAIIFAGSVSAADLLKFEGKVTETDGSELADGLYDFSFGLYASPTGGAAIWQESLNAANMFSASISGVTNIAEGIRYDFAGVSASSTLEVGQYLNNDTEGEHSLIIDFDNTSVVVASGSPVWQVGDSINNRPFVEGGVIDINLGAVNDISGVNFGQDLYLEITFNGETMQPRKVLTQEASAFNAERLDGMAASDFANLIDNQTISGEWQFNNIVGVATSSTGSALTVSQTGSGSIAQFMLGGLNALSVLNDGRLRIGDGATDYTLPASSAGASVGYILKLDASGDLTWVPDLVGVAGGYGAWASSSDNSFIYPADTAHIVVIGNNATSSSGYRFEVNGDSLFDNLSISSGQEIRFYDNANNNYIGLRATSTVTSSFVLTLPNATGMPGQALLTDGTGKMYWDQPTGVTFVNPGLEGQISYYASNGSLLSATSSIFIANNGYIGLGTTTPAENFTIGGIAGSQFMVNALGQVVGGSWQGDIVGEAYGGTGTSTYSVGDMLFADALNSLSSLPIGGQGEILVVSPAGIPSWVSTSSLNIDASTMTGILDLVHGGTGSDLSGQSGFIYSNGATSIASSVISILYTDLQASGGIVLTDNMLSLDTSGNWSGTFDGQEGSYYLDAINLNNFVIPFSAELSATTTDALAEGAVNLYWTQGRFNTAFAANDTDDLTEGAVNLYWTNQRFDDRLSATTSLPNITTLQSLQSVGTITGGTWQGDVLGVAYGGTGTSTYSVGDILFADALNSLSSLPVGNTGEILVISPAGIPSWVSTSSLNIDVGNMTGILDLAHGGTGSNLAGLPGFIYSNGTISTASSTISISYTDLQAMSGIVLTGSVLTLDVSGNWSGTFDGQEGSYYLNAVNLANFAIPFAAEFTSTTTDALTEGLVNLYWTQARFNTAFAANDTDDLTEGAVNLYWTNQRFDDRLSATTSLPNITTLQSLQSVGTITGGTWQGDVLGVAYGGLGTSTYARGDMIFANAPDSLDKLAIGADGLILQVVGGVPRWVSTTSLGIDFDAIGGILPIEKGGTGASTTAGALENLGLTDIENFGINSTGTAGWIWQSDGNGRGQWIATGSLGIMSGDKAAKFVGTTTVMSDGLIATGTLEGYAAANDICNNEFPGSFFCRTYDIMVSIAEEDISSWAGSAWIAEGPPGFISNSNDCNGWTTNANDFLGAYWKFNGLTGGSGVLTVCTGEKPLACCARQ